MRRYDDPVEVRRGTDPDQGPGGDGRPEQFLWRGRLWKVRAVLAHWVETGPWWLPGQSTGQAAGQSPLPGADLLVERELWRVEAGRGHDQRCGVFELSFSWTDGCWQLVSCAD